VQNMYRQNFTPTPSLRAVDRQVLHQLPAGHLIAPQLSVASAAVGALGAIQTCEDARKSRDHLFKSNWTRSSNLGIRQRLTPPQRRLHRRSIGVTGSIISGNSSNKKYQP